jgi:hypothetical protein
MPDNFLDRRSTDRLRPIGAGRYTPRYPSSSTGPTALQPRLEPDGRFIHPLLHSVFGGDVAIALLCPMGGPLAAPPAPRRRWYPPFPSLQPPPVIDPPDSGITTTIDGGHAAAISALRRSRLTSGAALDSPIFACTQRSPALPPPRSS